MAKSNSQQKSTPDTTSATSKWGLNGEEWAALLRVRIRPECSEGNLRALTDSNLNCGIARERKRELTCKKP